MSDFAQGREPGRSSTRVGERRKAKSPGKKKMKARTVVRRGEKSLLSNPESELHLGTEKTRATIEVHHFFF